MGIDPAGIAYAWGSVFGANLTPVHATQACYPPAIPQNSATPNAFLARLGDNGEVLQLTYLGIPPDLVAGGPIQFDSAGASLLYLGNSDIESNLEIVKLGPAASEIALSCVGNGASFENMPLAPNEIVSLFGTDIGPAQLISAHPDEKGIYPFQLGGTLVTFDGVPAPLLYAASNQVTLVTPRALLGKTTTHVCAAFNNFPAGCLDMPVQLAAPGIFSSGLLFGGSYPYAAAVNQDGTINSALHRAPAGSIVALFVTGLGTVTPPTPDGGITPYPPPNQDLNVGVTSFWNPVNPAIGLTRCPIFSTLDRLPWRSKGWGRSTWWFLLPLVW